VSWKKLGELEKSGELRELVKNASELRAGRSWKLLYW
jgi:hypothetical protein